MERLQGKETKREPETAEEQGGENIGQIMRTQRDSTEANQQNQRDRRENGQAPPPPRFQNGDEEKKNLPVEQGRSDRVSAGETVARPVDKRSVHEWALPMNHEFDQFIEQHAPWDGDDEGGERRPPSFPGKK